MIGNRILITGANGFIGHHLCDHLASAGREVTACIRPDATMPSVTRGENLRVVHIPDLADAARWRELLAEVDSVIHLAARVHVMQDRSADPLAEFRRVNVVGTSVLAEQAARAGIRRFLYLSSIKVNGEATPNGEFHADDQPGFLDPYGQSKWEAEQRLEEIAANSTMEWLVVRPTLVYGPGVRGNFLSLLGLIHRGFPLPLGQVKNRRSLVSVYNLVDLLAKAIDHPAAAGQRFLVKDAEDVSTGELVRRIAKALDRRPRLLSVPSSVLVRSSKLLRQEKVVRRLLDSLVVNTEKTTERLDWKAPMSLECALAKTCCWYENVAALARLP
jgi:nucleoside-diphosphate-sugar epimerase